MMKHVGKLQAAVVILVVLGFFATLGGLIWAYLFAKAGDVPPGLKEVLLIMVGVLGAEFGHCVQFSLKARTDELLAAAAPVQTSALPPAAPAAPAADLAQ